MFRVGMKVVCVGKPRAEKMARYPGTVWPEQRGIYTIKTINEWPSHTLLTFHELDNSSYVGKTVDGIYCSIEPGFNQKHFRPLTSPKQEVSFTTGAPVDSERWDNRVKRSPQKAVTALQS